MPRTPDQITAAMAALIREHEPQEARDQQMAELVEELAEAAAVSPTLEQRLAAEEAQSREASRLRDALAELEDEALAQIADGKLTLEQAAKQQP